jgi:8-oxo-dGTP pyrophosphatase MutT (NUDIX family)
MNSTRLDHVQIAAPPGCEAEARRWFGEVVGLAEVEKPEPLRGRGGVWFALGRSQLHVGVEEDFEPARKAHPALRIGELDALAARLEAAASPVRWDEAVPGERRFYSEDPWGNRIEFVAERDGGGTDGAADDEPGPAPARPDSFADTYPEPARPDSFTDTYLGRLRAKVGTDLVLAPGAMVVLRRADGAVLLTRRGDTGSWCMPGGAAEEGGSFAATAVAETAEEAGISVRPEDLVAFGCLSEADLHTVRYPSGDIVHCFALLFVASEWSGEPRADGEETMAIEWVPPGALPEPMHEPSRIALELLARWDDGGTFQIA